MIVRAEQFPEIKGFLVGFQCTAGSLFSARWLQSLLHQALLLDCSYSSEGILLSWSLLITIPLALRWSWSSGTPWLMSKPLSALAWPLAAVKDSCGCRGQGWGPSGGLSSGVLFLFPSRAVLRLCLMTAWAQSLCISPMLPFHSAEAVTVSVRDRQASGKAFSTLIRLYS